MSMASTSNQIDSSSSSSSSSTPPPRWNVFLSFRGEDTRKTFTGHLYWALDRAGIRTFMDDPELPRGEEISRQLQKAIQESKVSIVVFSKNYASSRWCLDELVRILECRRTMGQLVLPVFYDVDPRDVRHKKRSFAEAFESHKERYGGTNMEIVEKWEGALTKAANLSGYDLQNDANGDEAKLIQIIVKKVLLEVNLVGLYVAKQPVGIESRVECITPLLSIGTNDIRRIGIYGMGGIGKTTIAKALFNKNSHYFEGRCFLANVREVSEERNGILRLQKQLLYDILKVKEEVENVDSGISLLRERLCSKKVLIVLDDLDDLSQSDQLAGQWNQFASGSRIIITTRDIGVLDQIEVEERYDAKELDDDESLELFRRHAFKNFVPSDDYMEISKGIVRQAGGLPLALEVLGSYLFKKTMTEWRSSLDKLQQIPRHKISKKLMISYDALGEDGDLKDVFLDIACFFIGNDKEMTISILDSCGFNSESEISILIERCLLSINDNNELRMHDLLRDMGKEIVNKESPKDPGKRSRLWSSEDICKVLLKKQKGTEAIEGIIIPRGGKLRQETLNTKAFERMDKLRLLGINDVRLTGNFEHIFEELRWLSWQGCDLQCLPSDFHPEKLVILNLRFSKINILWHGILFLDQLKILNLDGCYFLTTTPNFTGVPNLEKLHLRSCQSLTEIHPSIGHLSRLGYLDLSQCPILKELPEELGNIESLRELLANNSGILKIPDSLCNLRVLDSLCLNNCISLGELPEELGNIESLMVLEAGDAAIKKLPDSIGRLSRLVNLNLGCCSKLRTLPSSLCNLKVLESLCLNECDNLEEFPEELGNIESLRELEAANTAITKLPDSIGRLSRLVNLNLGFCRKLRTLPSSLCNLKVLESLFLNTCDNLEELPEELGNIESLRGLEAATTAITKLPDSIGRLSRLVTLDLKFCRNLRTLPNSLCNLRVLDSLCLNDCISLGELPEELGNIESLMVLEAGDTAIKKLPDSIGRLSRLVNLNLGCCRKLRTLPSSLCNLKVLESLCLNDCDNLEEFPEELGNIESLRELEAANTTITKLPDSIGRLSRLVNLNLGCCSKLRTLPSSLCNLKVLESLCLNDCDNLEEFPEELGNIESLMVLEAGNTAITKLPDSIGRLIRLVNLNLGCCRKLRTLPSSLESLCLNDCDNLQEFPEELGNIESLRVLEAGNTPRCRMLKNIRGICKSPLRKLNLSSWEISDGNLSDNIGSLSSLERLDLNSCEISDGNLLDNIGSLSSLEELRLSFNIFSTLPSSLGQLSNLKEFYLKNCRSLRSVQKPPPNLTLLDASGCTSMERLHLSNLKHLEELDLSDCSRLVEIHGWETLTSIRRIELRGCNNLAITFNETFFQVYSGLGKEISIRLPTGWDCPDWFSHRVKGFAIRCDVPQNSENNFLGMILWVVYSSRDNPFGDLPDIDAVVENKTNGDEWTRSLFAEEGCTSACFIIPKRKIAVKFGDKIVACIRRRLASIRGGPEDYIIERFGVHLVYKSEGIENY